MKNIAIMATAGASGKDTVAEMIQNIAMKEANQKYVKTPLSQQIHEICDRMYFRGKDDPSGRVPRKYLQAVGEFMRGTFGEGVWIDLTDIEIEDIESDGRLSIITDVRKVTEYAHYCVESHFHPLYIKAPLSQIRNRLIERDGNYDEKTLHTNLETQMRFVETMPSVAIGENGLKKVSLSVKSHLNDIYIIDNSDGIENLEKQVKDWWCVINGD